MPRCKKYAYANDLALLHTSNNWKNLLGISSQDMTTLSEYFQSWRLKRSYSKTVTTTFHLNNRKTKRELAVYNNHNLLPFCTVSTYLGVKLDRSFTFRHYIKTSRKKMKSRVALLRELAWSGWGADAKTLRKAFLSLLYSSSEYCTSVWCCSAHTRLIKSVLYVAMRIATDAMLASHTNGLFANLSSYPPAELHRKEVLSSWHTAV